MERRSLLDAMWVMAIVASVVMLGTTAASAIAMAAADSSSTAYLDAWMMLLVCAPALVLAVAALAVLTLLRLRRDAAVDGEPSAQELPGLVRVSPLP